MDMEGLGPMLYASLFQSYLIAQKSGLIPWVPSLNGECKKEAIGIEGLIFIEIEQSV